MINWTALKPGDVIVKRNIDGDAYWLFIVGVEPNVTRRVNLEEYLTRITAFYLWGHDGMISVLAGLDDTKDTNWSMLTQMGAE